MKKITIILLIGLAGWFLFLRKSAASVATGGADVGNPLYFSLGKTMSDGTQTISQMGVDAIKRREGFSPAPYADPPGQTNTYSIWYGHQIKPGDDLPNMNPEQTLRDDLAWAEDAVNSNVSATLTQNQFDALVSFVYNVGKGAFTSGTVPQKLNDGDFAAAIETMMRYNSHHLKAVDDRRNDEIAQFNSEGRYA